jgi:hypothetical protein
MLNAGFQTLMTSDTPGNENARLPQRCEIFSFERANPDLRGLLGGIFEAKNSPVNFVLAQIEPA